VAKSALQLEIEGLKELQAKQIQLVKDLRGNDMAMAMRESVLILQRRAMQNPPGGKPKGAMAPVGYVPVDTGRLRASLTPVVRIRGDELQGIVGSNVTYAPYMEHGTPPHYPPRAALELWAKRHNTSAVLVQMAIGRRGNRALKFLKATLKENRARINARFDRAMDLIVKRRPR
jgi:phage gpG-like protein